MCADLCTVGTENGPGSKMGEVIIRESTGKFCDLAGGIFSKDE